jgi:hypothetical protein
MTRYLLILLIPLGIAFIGLGINYSSAAVYGYDRPLILDVGVDSILVPDTIAEYLEIISRIKNYGTEAIGGFSVEAKVWSIIDTSLVYDQTVVYTGGIYPGDILDIEFPGASLLTGTYLVQCSTASPGDENPANDTMSKIVVVIPLVYDLGIVSLPLPPDTIEGFLEIEALITSYGNESSANVAVEAKVWSIIDTFLPVYDQTVVYTGPISQGDTIPINFPEWCLQDTGSYLVQCSLLVEDENPSNNYKRKIIFNRQHQGIVDETKQIESQEGMKQTIITIAGFKTQLRKLKSKIYTATGQEIKPAYINHGIYFLKISGRIYKILTVR